jgi:hypothetical protein
MNRVPLPAAVHSSISLVAVGVAEGEDRAAPDELVDADRLAGLVVDEVDLRQAHEHGLARPHLELRGDRRADHLLGGMP